MDVIPRSMYRSEALSSPVGVTCSGAAVKPPHCEKAIVRQPGGMIERAISGPRSSRKNALLADDALRARWVGCGIPRSSVDGAVPVAKGIYSCANILRCLADACSFVVVRLKDPARS